VSRPHWLTARLEKAHPAAFSVYAIAAAFTVYFCMYAFRKPFTAIAYDGAFTLGGLQLDYKTGFVLAQLAGYLLSKFIGIKVISELPAHRRSLGIIVTIAGAWLGLLGFAVAPPGLKVLFMLINGLPLGMIWGLVFGYLEGRRLTELLGAGLSVSYIVASGYVKSVGAFLIENVGVPAFWMPFATGAVFFLPLLAGVWALARLPPPSPEDIALRVERKPMDGTARRAFLRGHALGLIPLTALYFLLTAYRSFRDDFAAELFVGLGYEGEPAIFARTETPIAFGVLLVLVALMFFRSNRRALLAAHAIMAVGTALIGLSTFAWQSGLVSGETWIILVGFGMYVAYVPYGCVLFDRMLGALGVVGTAGFMIYVTDAVGYIGTFIVYLYRNFGQAELDWVEFFTWFSYITSFTCTAMFAVAAMYFARASR
jgi:MFS family permease